MSVKHALKGPTSFVIRDLGARPAFVCLPGSRRAYSQFTDVTTKKTGRSDAPPRSKHIFLTLRLLQRPEGHASRVGLPSCHPGTGGIVAHNSVFRGAVRRLSRRAEVDGQCGEGEGISARRTTSWRCSRVQAADVIRKLVAGLLTGSR